MSIIFNKENRTFVMTSGNMSYVLGIINGEFLVNYHFGSLVNSINTNNISGLTYGTITALTGHEHLGRYFSMNNLSLECSSFGNAEYRTTSLDLTFPDGTTNLDLRYVSHKIFEGKNSLVGLPATYVENKNEAQTLEITMRDSLHPIDVILSYTVFEGRNLIARNVRIVNNCDYPVFIDRALSCCLDIPDSDFDILNLHGKWARETEIQRLPLSRGKFSIGSTRGSSSHEANPFIALLSKGSTETYGEVYGIGLVYSGNFIAEVEHDENSSTRVVIGINPQDFRWHLNPNECFQTPEAVLVYSNEGLGGMSREFHSIIRERLCRGKFRDLERPVLINNWEATYFDFDEAKILSIAKDASEIGIELMVMDDGWFGNRNSDKSSLGDWFENLEKLPSGVKGLGEKIKAMGMKFGIWFEPEMISSNSKLYEEHPDWCLHIPGRERLEARWQLTLDLSREDVQNNIIDQISNVLDTGVISYVKWDYNRYMSNVGSAAFPIVQQKEIMHRFVLGLYRILETLTSKYPEILFESCSSGGGRFDMGMLYYMPQTWTSDNTDAFERIRIQYGTSVVYPPATMGAHVSAVPNECVYRSTPLKFRTDVALFGNFGYELDLNVVDEDEKLQMKNDIKFVKKIRKLVQYGDFYRLMSPFENDARYAGWMVVSKNKKEALASKYILNPMPNPGTRRFKFLGLNKNTIYVEQFSGEKYTGAELMNIGFMENDGERLNQSHIWHFIAE